MSKPKAVSIGVGGEQGSGAAVVRCFAKGGHHVLVAGRTPAKIEQVVRSIEKSDAIAETCWQVHGQPRSAWMQEIDLRPFKGTF